MRRQDALEGEVLKPMAHWSCKEVLVKAVGGNR